MGKKPKGNAGRDGGQSSNVVAWTFSAAAVAFVAWRCFPAGASKDKAQPDEPLEEVDELSDKLGAVRQRLFSEDGSANFVVRKPGSDSPKKVEMAHSFSDADYWEKRYTSNKKERYDWYGTWNSQSSITIKPHVLSFMPEPSRPILNVGVGNSRFPEELHNDGYSNVVSIDISSFAVNAMSKQLAGKGGLSFLQMDASQMTFPDGSFRTVFEKGTLDALYTGSKELVEATVAQVYRVLQPNGTFISTTFGSPETRQELNHTTTIATSQQPSGWESFKTIVLNRGDDSGAEKIYIYIMKKPDS